jgi:hypothetical protein
MFVSHNGSHGYRIPVTLLESWGSTDEQAWRSMEEQVLRF